MTRREFFRSVLPGLHGKNDRPVDNGRESLQELFLQAMAQGLDPASYTCPREAGMNPGRARPSALEEPRRPCGERPADGQAACAARNLRPRREGDFTVPQRGERKIRR